jgi:lysosomal-associated membrane protein 1/2
VPSTNNTAGILRISHLQVQAFRNETNTKFDEALDCQGSETPDVVPIAVGCALAALVIIVLVAYLIGRRRSQARGYLSM